MPGLFADVGFAIHLLVYAAVNLLLVSINLSTTPGELWFVWPLAGWGVGVAGHAAAVIYCGRRTRRSIAQAMGVRA